MWLAEWMFWGSLAFIFYAYAGYVLVLWILSWIRSRPVLAGDIRPTVSFVITAYNEEMRIKDKIENSLKQQYPRERLEIVVASDCSSDRTDDLVREYAPLGVRLIRAPERKGKEAAQKVAVSHTSGEVLVFSDVATTLPPEGIANIVKSFHDPSVGCVSSVDRFVDAEGNVSGEGAYVKYEMLLRRLETKVNTLVGLSGSFFAARRTVCTPWADDLQSDFNTLLNSMKAGLRGVSDSHSVGYYKNLTDEKKEYQRKVRTVLRGIAVLMRSLPMLNPFRYGMFAWQLFSHKLCRWLVPFAMIAAFVSNIVLAMSSPIYRIILMGQIIFYSLAAAYAGFDWFPKNNLFRLPSFFVLVNLSILDAWVRFLRGDRVFRWEPSKR
ncbi:MAG TPA: glycosyltransferase family 2 protein [Nitrospira sp.]|jgi:glycosyltransferase involved in cell wall biosynthesis|nr:glycosyltransferase family 2 protein [Nitrospira sp.]